MKNMLLMMFYLSLRTQVRVNENEPVWTGAVDFRSGAAAVAAMMETMIAITVPAVVEVETGGRGVGGRL